MTPALHPVLQSRLAGVRARHVRVHGGAGFALALTVLLGLATLAMLLDWWLDFPLWARGLILASTLAATGALLWRHAFRFFLRQPDDDAVALMIEAARPEFRTRLIASVQLAQPGGVPGGTSQELVGALVAETAAVAEVADFSSVISTRAFHRRAALAAVTALAAFGFFFNGGETSRDLLKRFLLSSIEVPRKTRVEITTGDRLIGRGDAVTIEALGRGLVPASGTLRLKYPSGRVEEFLIEADKKDAKRFSRTMENVQESFTYQVLLGDGRSREFVVRAEPRPEAGFIDCRQTWPAYTQLPSTRRALGDLALLAGSKLHLKITATKECQSGVLRLVGLDQDVPLRLSGTDARELTGEFAIPATNLTGFSVVLTDRHGIRTRDPALYRVDVLPDKPPVVRVLHPERKEDLITRQGRVLIAFEASDDFAVARVLLRHKTDTVDKGAEKSVELDIGPDAPKSLRHRYEWDLSKMIPSPTEGSLIEFWLEVQDANNVTGPGIGTSDHYSVKIVSEADKRADLMNRVSDYLSGVGEIATDQEKLNRALGTIIREKR